MNNVNNMKSCMQHKEAIINGKCYHVMYTMILLPKKEMLRQVSKTLYHFVRIGTLSLRPCTREDFSISHPSHTESKRLLYSGNFW